MSGRVVIVGAGQAGLTASMELRKQGWDGEIHLVGEEEHLPYQRPPLSKGYLSGEESRRELLLRSAEALDRDGIVLHLSTKVITSVERFSIGPEREGLACALPATLHNVRASRLEARPPNELLSTSAG